MILKLEKLIEEIKKVYDKNSQTQFQFYLVDPLSGLALLYQMKRKMAKSINIYEQVFRIVSNIKDVDSYLKGDANRKGNEEPVNFSHLSIQVAAQLVHANLQLDNFTMAAKWAKLLIMFEGFNGVDVEAARKKHSLFFTGLSI